LSASTSCFSVRGIVLLSVHAKIDFGQCGKSLRREIARIAKIAEI
jgi:hypothetical protein